MAVQKMKRVKTGEGYYDYKYEPDGEPEYVGAVVALTADYNVRVMSDIWADEFYAVVWTGNGTTRVFTHSNFECDTRNTKAEVDATPEVMAAYEAWKAAEADRVRKEYEVRCERERLEREEKERLEPKMGRRARVVRGRKVPVGTEGVVFWKGTGEYGERLGLATTDRKVNGRYADVVWVASSNVENVESDEDYEARKKVLDAAKAAEKAARDAEWQRTQDEAKAAREKSLENLDDEPVPF